MRESEESIIGVVGLGYVGLPLAVEFSKHYSTIGYDTDGERIAGLYSGTDVTREVEDSELTAADSLRLTDKLDDLSDCNVYIVTVPTPIDSAKRPDLSALLRASRSVGEVLNKGDVVIFESTVYPGATEDDCAPILEATSGLKLNQDFFLGYSPERVNPGDREHRLTEISKITSGSTPEAANFIDSLYRKIIKAGTYRVSSIRVAEAAKVIENTQRDVNIALINELALIFNRMGLDTREILDAAGTKWNFLNFRPGLVGGHCIGVDPYYLTHKSQEIGYHPDIILAGRRINDNMGIHVASEVVKLMVKRGISMPSARILIMGITFKENCPDVRNTRVIDLISELQTYGSRVDIYDPWADVESVSEQYGINITNDMPAGGQYDSIVLAVAHREFHEMSPADIHALGKPVHIIYDIKYVLPTEEVDGRL